MSNFIKLAQFAKKSPDLRSAYLHGFMPARKWLSSFDKPISDFSKKVGTGVATMNSAIGMGGLKSYAFGGGGGMLAGGALGGAYGLATGQQGGFTSGAMMGAAMGLGHVGMTRHTPVLNSTLKSIGEPIVNHKGIMKGIHDYQEMSMTKPIRTAAAAAGLGWLGTAVGTEPVNKLRRV